MGIYLGKDAKKEVSDVYVGVGGKPRKVTEGYVGAGGGVRQFYTAGPKLGEQEIGSEIKIPVGGTDYNWIVVNQGRPSTLYDTSCSGTWLMMEMLYGTQQWSRSNDNRYASSNIHTYLNSIFLNLFDTKMQQTIIQAKIPYGAGNATDTVYSGSNGLSAKVFLLSAYEVGYTNSDNNVYIPIDGSKLSYFYLESEDGELARLQRVARRSDGVDAPWWLRTPYTLMSTGAYSINYAGQHYSAVTTGNYYTRPVIILPSKLQVTEDGHVAL